MPVRRDKRIWITTGWVDGDIVDEIEVEARTRGEAITAARPIIRERTGTKVLYFIARKILPGFRGLD